VKIGIGLVGLSSGFRNRDWRRTKDEIKNKVINCWSGHEVNLYLSTEDITQELLDFYNPKKYVDTKLVPFIHTEFRILNKLIYLVNVMENEDLDLVIITRFDIIFFNSLSSLNIDYNKFNFLFREKNHFYDGRGFTCDNLYVFPKHMLSTFKESFLDPTNPTNKGHFHDQVYLPLKKRIGEENIHFIDENECYSGCGMNDYYLLDRYDNIDGDQGPTSIEKYYEWKKLGNPFI